MKLEDMTPNAPIEMRLNGLLGMVYSAHHVGARIRKKDFS